MVLEHVLANRSDGVAFPSIFDLFMQEKLNKSMRSAFLYILKVLSDTYPSNNSLTRLLLYSEEAYAVSKLLLERYCLELHDSTLSEYFYGMKRVIACVPKEKNQSFSSLNSERRKKAILFVALFPYMKAKLDQFYERCKQPENIERRTARIDDERSDSTSTVCVKTILFFKRWFQLQEWNRHKRIYQRLYPLLHFCLESTYVLYQWLYLVGNTRYFSPLLHSLGIVLVARTPQDQAAYEKIRRDYRIQILAKLSDGGPWKQISRILYRLVWTLADHFYVSVMLGLVGYKMLEWIHSEEGAAASTSARIGSDGPVPPPPLAPPLTGPTAHLALLHPSLCSLCLKTRTNPAASSSGHVFCYPCIYEYVKRHQKCPLTNIKCDISTIIKVYDETPHLAFE
ncbi:unnamed protein product [Albugo candida]|uniref:Peroxin-12 n=3 Tax=Albugo candida TaxID=65357 RepID=A0A024G0D0_9STRA|nr:unnamed protein product [Albugo candida]|eukprot:CCI39998.1 unnamed protein product [Albugo candida]